MNETLKVIRNRRSIRNFMDEQIKKEELDAILEAGLYAPSGMNSQDWHFTVIQNRKMIDTVNEWILPEIKKRSTIPGLMMRSSEHKDSSFEMHLR